MSEITILCLKIFLARVFNVSLGTIRSILSIKGQKLLASFLSFIESFMWFVIVKEAIQYDGKNLWVAFFYAFGFAIGTFVGTFLSKYFVKGTSSVQIITDDKNLDEKLRKEGYVVSVVEASGLNNAKRYLLFMEVKSKSLKKVRNTIKTLSPDSFVTIKDSEAVYNGIIL